MKFIICLAGILCFFSCGSAENTSALPPTTLIVERPQLDFERTQAKALEAFAFCKSKNYSTDFCFLIDMSLHSGIKRFVVWDFKKDTIVNSFLVAHGSGNNPWDNDLSKESPAFSNEENSHCSSLGKYKIGARAPSQWGVKIKYELHGLEPTNNNALKRFVVLHSWDRIPDSEIYPAGAPEGWGCPVLSINSFRIVDSLLQEKQKPVLLWIYTRNT